MDGVMTWAECSEELQTKVREYFTLNSAFTFKFKTVCQMGA